MNELQVDIWEVVRVNFPTKIDGTLQRRCLDMIRAFESESFISSLSLALSLPDICGNYLYSNDSSRNRYSKWFDQFVAFNYIGPDGIPYFDGEDCYQLRCVFLHEGMNTPHVERKRTLYNLIQFRIFDDGPLNNVDHFEQLWTNDELSNMFTQLDLNLNKFISVINQGVNKFIRQYPNANNLNPWEGYEGYFYTPILDFRKS